MITTSIHVLGREVKGEMWAFNHMKSKTLVFLRTDKGREQVKAHLLLEQGCQTHFSSRAAWSKSILMRAGLQISFLKKTWFKKFFSFLTENVHITSNP